MIRQYYFSLVLCLIVASTVVVNAWVQLKTSPLVGGPSWLPVHVKVIVEGEHIYDFLPKNPKSPQTLQKLLSFQEVPGQIRYNKAIVSTSITTKIDDIESEESPSLSSSSESLADMASNFCTSYPSNLHLVTNNCWTFAFSLIWHLRMESNKGMKIQ